MTAPSPPEPSESKRTRLIRMRAMAHRHGLDPINWRKRLAIFGGAIVLGLVALLFTRLADAASHVFDALARRERWLPLIVTPAGFAVLVWLLRRFAPDARGSGIQQVIAARLDPEIAETGLVGTRTAVTKFVLTLGALLFGASVGREGPTVQISAAIMAGAHRLLRLPIRASVIVAGGAAGIAAAFNTPLAGVTFAIEELAAAYEQRMTLLVMTAVLLSGMVSLGIAGNYVYFGSMRETLALEPALAVIVVTGCVGGLTGGSFARAMLAASFSPLRPFATMRARPILLASAAGAVVAVIGCVTGATWGTGYAPARAAIEGIAAPWWFGPAKYAASLATAVSGLPGGIFAPSLATGTGLGSLLRPLFPDVPAGPIVLLGMAGYFTGVVRAPLTATVIISEATESHGLLLPLLATALIADSVSALVCPERLYAGLAQPFVREVEEEEADIGKSAGSDLTEATPPAG